MSKKWWCLLFILLLLGLDQASKYWAVTHLTQPLPVFSGLRFVLTHNRGIAFGFLRNSPEIMMGVLIALALLVVAFLLWHLLVFERLNTFQALATAAIAAGALGNVLDRIRLGYVVDFIMVYYREWYWPIFNVADMSLCIGVFLWWWGERRRVDT